MANEINDQQLIQTLTMWANGRDLYGNRISPADQAAAMQKLIELKERQRLAALQTQRVEAEQARVAAESALALAQAEKARAEAEAELRRLEIEQERLQIEKADVYVRALEVVAKSGAKPEQLMDVVRSLGVQMIGGPAPLMPLALEDKQRKSDD